VKNRIREIRILYTRELRSALRERNIVINSLILPLALYPAIIWLVIAGITFVVGQSETSSARVTLRNVPIEHQQLEAFLAEQDGIEVIDAAQAEGALGNGALDLLVDFVASDGTGGTAVGLVYDGSRDRSSTARSRVEDYLGRYRRQYLLDLAGSRGIPVADVQHLWVDRQNMASGQDMGRFILGMLVPVFMIVMLSVGGMYSAIDSTAGEREHGTWETLMTVSADRSSILVAKYLYVATMSFAAGMLNLVGMSLSLGTFLRPLLGSAVDDLNVQLPLDAILVITVGAALLALFIAAGMMILASFARTFKEGQSLVGPFYVAIFLPVLFLQAPDLEFSTTLALIPIVNVTMMFREAFAGIYQWQMIGLTVAVELATITMLLLLANRILRYEDFVIGGYSGHFGRFLKERLSGRS
jgi:sodium transport system permease protein